MYTYQDRFLDKGGCLPSSNQDDGVASPAVKYAERLAADCAGILTQIEEQIPGHEPRMGGYFLLMGYLGELSFILWPADDFSLPSREWLTKTTASLRNRLTRLLALEGKNVGPRIISELQSALDELEARSKETQMSFMRLRRVAEQRVITRDDLPLTSYELEHDLLTPFDGLNFALALCIAIGLILPADIPVRLKAVDGRLKEFLYELDEIYSRADDTLRPDSPELFPHWFWWRRLALEGK